MSSSTPTPCTHPGRRGRGPCVSYAPGHRLHITPARLAGETPWNWRDAVVARVDGHEASAQYVAEQGSVRFWHHEDLAGVIAPGEPVRVHERYRQLLCPAGLLSVAVLQGLGSVPDPEVPEAWLPERTVGIVDLSTGRGLWVPLRGPQAQDD